MDSFIGQIQIFGFTFPPRNWAFCDGQLIPILENTALFSLIGTTYGGDGQNTFALPDLRGRAAVHPGQGPGLSLITWGQRAGVETTTLLTDNLPAHNHALMATNSDADSDEPLADSKLGVSNSNVYATTGTSNIILASDTTSVTGGNAPFEIRNPYLGVKYSISLFGIFPPRD